MRYTRNGECWCGSGKKYKHCHFEFDQKIVDLRLNGCLCPSHELIKNEKEFGQSRKVLRSIQVS